MHGRHASPSEPVHEVRRADTMLLDGGVANEVDVGHDDHVGAGEAAGKALQQEARPAVLVWLKDADQTRGSLQSPQGAEGRVDLGGMMPVVVVDRDMATGNCASAEPLHSALQPPEGAEGRPDPRPRGAEVAGENGGGGGVERVVGPGHRVRPAGQHRARPPQGHGSAGRVEENFVVGGGTEAEGLDRAGQGAGDLVTMSTLVGDEQAAALGRRRQSAGEGRERLHDRRQRIVDVKVVLLDVVDESEHRPVVVERAVELTSLGDEDPGPARPWARAGDRGGADSTAASDLRAGGPDDDARVEAALNEDVAEHRRGGALAVCPGDGDPGSPRLHQPQGLGIAQDPDPSPVGLEKLGMIGLDRGRSDDQVAVFGNGVGGLPVADRKAVVLEGLRHWAADAVRAAADRPAPGQQPGKPAETASTDPDTVDPATVTERVELRRIQGCHRRRRTRHRSCIDASGPHPSIFATAAGGASPAVEYERPTE